MGIYNNVKALGGGRGGSELSDVLRLTATNIYIGDGTNNYSIEVLPDDTRIEIMACNDIQEINLTLYAVINDTQHVYYQSFNGQAQRSVVGAVALRESEGKLYLDLDNTYYKFNKTNITYIVRHYTYS